ncbi:hypothetical protein B296_00027818 [Ensete ventricosum]|uniref:Uncharacterized protein n=1 Tax=Ensete ventricosum TaxID=4639 RepID=A0A427ACD8_ENSVE|nr:hypothetical protein B296_00027818 [Ensete ventricosum]
MVRLVELPEPAALPHHRRPPPPEGQTLETCPVRKSFASDAWMASRRRENVDARWHLKKVTAKWGSRFRKVGSSTRAFGGLSKSKLSCQVILAKVKSRHRVEVRTMRLRTRLECVRSSLRVS